jgi:hypothetical protein
VWQKEYLRKVVKHQHLFLDSENPRKPAVKRSQQKDDFKKTEQKNSERESEREKISSSLEKFKPFSTPAMPTVVDISSDDGGGNLASSSGVSINLKEEVTSTVSSETPKLGKTFEELMDQWHEACSNLFHFLTCTEKINTEGKQRIKMDKQIELLMYKILSLKSSKEVYQELMKVSPWKEKSLKVKELISEISRQNLLPKKIWLQKLRLKPSQSKKKKKT